MPFLLFVAAILGGVFLFARRSEAAINPNPIPIDPMNKSDKRLTRGERNNNPGNIRQTDADWIGERATDSDPAFEEFTTPEDGIRALARLLLNPLVLTYPIGATPIWNWLLYGYGLPLLAFAFAAWHARRTGLDAQPDSPFALATQLEAGAIALTVALVMLQIHQFFHGDGFAHGAMNLAEAGALSIAWIALGLLFRAAQARWPRPSFAVAGTGLVHVGLVATILLPGLGFNPLWSAEAVGERWIANDLLWVFGVPLVLFAIAGRSAWRRGQTIHGWVWNIASFVLAFALLNLEIRQAFHGTRLDGGLTSVAERYTYSTAWALFGVGLLIAGIVRKGRPLRVAGLGVILLTAAKVFLVDMSSLSGLYRIFSFFGLGVSLMLIAYLYQRFVFRKESS